MTHPRAIHPHTLASLRALKDFGALNLGTLRQHVPGLHWPDGRVTPFAEHPGLPA